jgi:hypothetical protein
LTALFSMLLDSSLSLPFLITLGAEKHLATAVGAFWMRATLMQAATPLLQRGDTFWISFWRKL